MEKIKVVVRYRCGRLIKSFTQDFIPAKKLFHLTPVDNLSGEPIEVSIEGLKAIFMVGDFVGHVLYKERKKYVEGEEPSGKKVEVTFIDGEVLVGSTMGCDPNRQGFFIPADPTTACSGLPINPASGGAERYMDKVDKTHGERK